MKPLQGVFSFFLFERPHQFPAEILRILTIDLLAFCQRPLDRLERGLTFLKDTNPFKSL